MEDEGQEAHAEIGFGVEFDAAPLEDEEAPMMELLCGSSDEEVEVPTTFTTVKVKSFHQRAAYAALQAKGLTDIARHIVGCSIGYHKSNRQWHGFYPDHTLRTQITDAVHGPNHSCNSAMAVLMTPFMQDPVVALYSLKFSVLVGGIWAECRVMIKSFSLILLLNIMGNPIVAGDRHRVLNST